MRLAEHCHYCALAAQGTLGGAYPERNSPGEVDSRHDNGLTPLLLAAMDLKMESAKACCASPGGLEAQKQEPLDRLNFGRSVLGFIEADFCK